MTLRKVMYVGQTVADQLLDSVTENLWRYTNDGFEDLVSGGNWSIPLSVDFDPESLLDLNPAVGAEAEVENSKRVWKSLRSLTPAMACENRIWVRFSHVDCLEYCRTRWLEGKKESSLDGAIKTHLFANTQTRWRDDHAISRLWWNSWIAHRAFPGDPDTALELLLSKADVRSNLVERPWLFSRVPLASAIFRLLLRNGWPLAQESNFRELMKAVNLLGAGVVFEAMRPEAVDEFLDRCVDRAGVFVRVAERLLAAAEN